MEYRGSSAYDNESFYENYMRRRNREDNPNYVIEEPVILELIGDVTGKHILDLGCGDARFGKELAKQGCAYYEGVEGSSHMVRSALQQLDPACSRIHHASMEAWDYPARHYDLVVSRLALHYVEDLQLVLGKIRHALKADGRFVFSVQHPVLTSCVKSAEASGKRLDWIVDDYFKEGERTEPWIGEQVVKYHRTIEGYYQALRNAGFHIEDIRECVPRLERFRDEEEYRRRLRIPLFLVFHCGLKA
ncbi:trans-aconitate 2-methyltransferase [Paenibacillus sp. GD4]|uniref:class I SAM-dependent methyltransferase n=1 Tax=Paenibacillus sp. GD4 TaxID=3068890 RepID=UPI00358E9AED